MKKKRVVVSVINDLATDQRVERVCKTIYDMGFDVLLIGRKLPNSLNLSNRQYKTIRMNLFFKNGLVFYSVFNLRLFILLLFTRFDILHANDLDTLLPNFLVSKIKRKKLVYDSHEFFTEVPELKDNKIKKCIWEKIEEFIFPKLKYVFTVNESIANIYQKKYNVKVEVVRNLPYKIKNIEKDYSLFEIDFNKKIIIYQGAGINVDRGGEELVEAMKFVDGAILVVAGDGDVVEFLKEFVKINNLEEKVKFFPKMPYEKLIKLTALADCGVTLDKDTNLNYRYSLPNKLFDYIMAKIPVLSSDLPEIKKIINKYNIGLIVDVYDVENIAEKINQILFEINKNKWEEGLENASNELCWENEKSKLVNIYEKFLNN